MKHLIVIKFGGGIITDKEKPFTARPATIKRLAQDLATIRKDMPEAHFLLGNGAGSFAHFTADEYGLREGAHTSEQFYGMSIAHNGVQKLNTLITDALLAAHVPAFSLTPSSFLYCDNKIVSASLTEPLMHLLANDCVPVVFGDTICDTQRGTTILSTEKILNACVQSLRSRFDKITVVYMFGANGVLDAAGQTIPVLGNAAEVVSYNDLKHDVTGGITGKIAAARLAASVADDVYLIGDSADALRAVLSGKVAGTKILP
ncbi:MAG TPA: isopentenyl phosphate kinase [Patescibacteria group bacterium]|nr:isopentenyl phosphate kinase [Patescibacteria group bacterium]